jgi:hypothetical protein
MKKLTNFRRHGCRLQQQIWGKKIAYNVPALYDVFTAAETAQQFQQP